MLKDSQSNCHPLEKPKVNLHQKRFYRRKLPYHLVQRCYRRVENRSWCKIRFRRFGSTGDPILIISEWAYSRLQTAKLREHKAKMDLVYYEAIVGSKIYPRFELHQPNISLLDREIARLGPGGLPLEHYFEDFALISPSSDLEESVHALMARAGDFRRVFCGAQGGDAWNTPLIWDTGASTGLTPFRSDFCADFEEINMPIQAVGSTGTVTGRGTVLRQHHRQNHAKQVDLSADPQGY